MPPAASKCAKYMPESNVNDMRLHFQPTPAISGSWMAGPFAAKQDLRGSEGSEEAIFQKRRGSFFSQMAGGGLMYFLVCASREESFPCSIDCLKCSQAAAKERRWIAPLPCLAKTTADPLPGCRGHDGGSTMLHPPYQTRQ